MTLGYTGSNKSENESAQGAPLPGELIRSLQAQTSEGSAPGNATVWAIASLGKRTQISENSSASRSADAPNK